MKHAKKLKIITEMFTELHCLKCDEAGLELDVRVDFPLPSPFKTKCPHCGHTVAFGMGHWKVVK